VTVLRVPAPPFVRFVLRRAAALVLLGLGITLVAFVFTQLVPSDPVAANLGERAAGDPAAVQAFEERYGLDEPIPVQYWRYLSNLLRGDLGESLQDHQPVRQAVRVLRLPERRDRALDAGEVLEIGGRRQEQEVHAGIAHPLAESPPPVAVVEHSRRV
jgi:hypothetical protein